MNLVVRETILKPSPESRIREMEQWKSWNPDKLLEHLPEKEVRIPTELLAGEWPEARKKRLRAEAAMRCAEHRAERIQNAIYVALILAVCAIYVIGCYTIGA